MNGGYRDLLKRFAYGKKGTMICNLGDGRNGNYYVSAEKKIRSCFFRYFFLRVIFHFSFFLPLYFF